MQGLKSRVELVVASGKGGVGKSTIAASLAIVLAEKSYNVVAADADAEAPNMHLVLGVGEPDEIIPYYEGRLAYILEDKCLGESCGLCVEACSYEAIEPKDGKYQINPFICEGCITCSAVCPVKAIRYRFRVRAGEIRVYRRTLYGFPLVSGEIRPGRPNSGKLVTEVKNKAHSILGSRNGVIVVDAAAGIGCQVISSLTGAQLALLVAEPTPASLSDLKRIHLLTKHFGIAPMLVINKYDLNPSYVEEIKAYAERENIPIIGMVPYDESVPRSMAQLKPLIKAYPDSPAAKAVKAIAGFVAEKVLPDWRRWWVRYRPKKPVVYTPLLVKPEASSLKRPPSFKKPSMRSRA
ncbi:MAG: ATP-binding protein [Pyrodictiaceae archaeon]